MRYRFIDILRGTQIFKGYKAHLHFSGTPESLKSMQNQKLCDLLLFLQRSHPYYRHSLIDVPPSQIRKNPKKIVAALPVVDKSFITRNTNLLLQHVPGRKYQANSTGGSTGDPLYYYADLAAISQAWAYILWSWHTYAGYSPGDPYMTVAGASLGVFANRMKCVVYRILQNNYLIAGDSISPNICVPSRWIRHSRLLYGYPSSISSLLEIRSDLFKGHRLKAVFTTSEQLLPTVRCFIEARLGVPVYDIYGANDGGAISCECDVHQGFHYDPLTCYIEEYRNEDGLTELLLTNLDAFCFPFIRYRVGDVAELDDFGSCPCGSPFPMIRNLNGRTRDMVKLKNGRKVHGTKFNKFVLHYPEIRRYRVIQSSNYNIAVQVDIENFDVWVKSPQRSHFEHMIGDMLPGVGIVIEKLAGGANGNNKFKVIESHVH